MLHLGTAGRPKIFSKIISIMLVFVFTVITAVQGLHKHQTSCIDNDDADTEYVYSSEKCSICDYLIQKQSQHAHLSYAPVITAPVTKAVTLLSRSYAGVYKFTLQGFTNKGPPAVSC